jgi:hypothetical protein
MGEEVFMQVLVFRSVVVRVLVRHRGFLLVMVNSVM